MSTRTPMRRQVSTPLSHRQMNELRRDNIGGAKTKTMFQTARRALQRPSITSRPPSAKSLVDSPRIARRQEKVKCKRSISLQNLSQDFQKKLTLRRKNWSKDTATEIISNPCQKMNAQDDRTTILLLKSYSRFLKNSWRKAKDRQKDEHDKLVAAEAKIENMDVQISALKNFLTGDREIITNLTNQLVQIKQFLNDSKADNSKLQAEKNLLQASVDKMTEKTASNELEIMNLRNVCQTAQSEAQAYEQQLKKEREKIAELRLEAIQLSGKIVETKKESYAKELELIKMANMVKRKEIELTEKNKLISKAEENAAENLEKFRGASDKITNLENEVLSLILRNESLSKEISELEKTSSERSQTCEILESTIQQNYVTIIEMNTALEAVTALSWKSKFYSAINTMLQVPIWALTMGGSPHVF
ncbi:titin homolog [Cimex lectularius]|uniref:Uncharacterized protein n=1 Tax=Cimex lectularius TaxID=79782 RepID=A0A8I6RUU8_CIMLE|nr:titin homolog [Cimex lectularius]